ncbi:hypothetical protein PM8797T_13073 [Gimesia maris DSM 8797]|nr:hypothetical protein PM8797T_13073 [Gimesia maris DSM 8797]
MVIIRGNNVFPSSLEAICEPLIGLPNTGSKSARFVQCST